MADKIFQELHPYFPYLIALFIFWLFTRMYGGHVSHFIRDLFAEIRALATGRPFVAVVNFIGGVMLFAVIIFLIGEARFDFIYGGSPSPGDVAFKEHAMYAALAFFLGLYFLLCVALTRHSR